jgi:hypothetical protein
MKTTCNFWQPAFQKRLVLFFTALCFIVGCSYAQTTYHWAPITTDWQTAANWLPVRTSPASSDVLVFDNGINNTITNVPSQNIGQLKVEGNTSATLQAAAPATILSITGAAGPDLTIATASALNIDGDNNDLSISVATSASGIITGSMHLYSATVNTAHKLLGADAGSIVFNSPAVFTQGFRCNGNVFGSTGQAGTIIFNSGTVFIQDGGTIANANPFALAAPASKVIFNTGSLYRHQQNGVPSMAGRTYAGFELNYAAANIPVVGGTVTAVDDLTITAGQLNLNLPGGVHIKGDIVVAAAAALSFNAASLATVSFSGTANQTITNNGTLTFGINEAVEFNNAAGITLNSDITFNNLVSFTSGIITNNTALLTLSATATVAGVSNASFVNGKVKKIGNTAFVFPVGKIPTGYVPIAISAQAFAGNEYIAEYRRPVAATYPIAPTTVGLDHVSSADHWILDFTGTPAPVDITLYWTNESSSGGAATYITDLASLAIAHSNGVVWDSYGGVSLATGTVVAGSITWPAVNVYGPFSLASINFANPLPVNLNYFTGRQQNNRHVLNWKVSCNNNDNTTMMLERSSDKQYFTVLTSFTAMALRCLQPFDHTDRLPLAGMNYYRLKMVAANGTITYTAIVALLNISGGFEMINLQPSVVTNTAVLNINAAQKAKIGVLITDVTGRQIRKISFNLVVGSNQFNLYLGDLGAGTYQITGYTGDGNSKTIRFVKQ